MSPVIGNPDEIVLDGSAIITAANWKAEIVESLVPVAVVFWAPWNAPCQKIKPTLAALRQELGPHVRWATVNVMNHQDLTQRWDVRAVPTLQFWQSGRLVTTLTGAPKRDQLAGAVANFFKRDGAAAH
jgi:thioredoxin 1